MPRRCSTALLPLILLSAAPFDTPSALESDPVGWTDLLVDAGKDLKGWTRLPIPPGGKSNPKSQWSLDAKTGYLVCEGNGGHEWLRWDDELTDFVYHIEWRFTPAPGKRNYNSGVYARNSADAKTWLQAQTGDASGGFLFGDVPGPRDTMKRINLQKEAKEKRVKPAGEWNTFEITARGPRMTLWVNGAVANDWKDCPVKSGHVGVEAEGYRIEFRNVKLKRLAGR